MGSLALLAAVGCFCSLASTASVLSHIAVLADGAETQRQHVFSVRSLQDAPAGAAIHIRADSKVVLQATRAAGLSTKTDRLRFAAVGKEAKVIFHDVSDSTVLCAVRGIGKVWFPIGALLYEQTHKLVPTALVEQSKRERGNRTHRASLNSNGTYTWSPWPRQADGQPVYPIEPLLDGDYIYDDNEGHSNYLEDYDNTSELVDRILARFGYSPENVSAALQELPPGAVAKDISSTTKSHAAVSTEDANLQKKETAAVRKWSSATQLVDRILTKLGSRPKNVSVSLQESLKAIASGTKADMIADSSATLSTAASSAAADEVQKAPAVAKEPMSSSQLVRILQAGIEGETPKDVQPAE